MSETISDAEIMGVIGDVEWLAGGDQSEGNKAVLLRAARILKSLRDERTALKERVRELEKGLTDARDNGLSYWEPQTARGYEQRNLMFARIAALLPPTKEQEQA